MAILVNDKSKVLVQGITGRTGSFATRYMLQYGTNVIAGVTPGRQGERIWGIPVYDRVAEAIEQHGPVDVSLITVPGDIVKGAVLEAIEADIKTIVMPVERMPLHDILEIIAYARQKGIQIVGPGSFGVIAPGKAVIGWVGGSPELAEKAFKPGRVGVISRSGGQTTTISWNISKSGSGISTAVHVGAEPILGLTEVELLELFQADPDTDGVALFGEIGTVQEEEAAQAVSDSRFTKPLVAYIAGAQLPTGMRFSHASAIVERGRGSAESKITALKKAGAHVVDKPDQIAYALSQVLKH